ncbi:MAG: PfkB family carbohydrate kinase, partial [Spirochaetaceae bacterium]|nr:PfkB family carbohydrate kinase [Spirochaetaceae bacterium]
ELDALLEALETNPESPVAMYREPGGSVFNSLKIAAALGGRSVFSGTCGNAPGRTKRADKDALFFRRIAAKRGVECALRTVRGVTGRCLVVQCKGETAVAAAPGAAPLIEADQFDETLAAGADCVILEGMASANEHLTRRIYRFCVARKTALALCAATRHGARCAAAFLRRAPGFPDNPLGKDFPVYLFANRGEGHILRQEWPEKAPPRDLVYLESAGREGGVLFVGGQSFSWNASPPPAPMMDETGAGDAFAGAFLTARLGGSPLQDALETAAKIAATITAHPLCFLVRAP